MDPEYWWDELPALPTTPQLPIYIADESAQGDEVHLQEESQRNWRHISSSTQPLSSGSRNNSEAKTDRLGVGPYSSSSGAEVKDPSRRAYMKFDDPKEIEKLIQGIEKHGKRWKAIKNEFFNDSARTKNKLKEKWRHMVKSAYTEKNPILKELYIRAKKLDDDIRNPRWWSIG